MNLPNLIPIPNNVFINIQHFNHEKIKKIVKNKNHGIVNYVNRNTKYATMVTVYDENQQLISIGISRCGKLDVPNKKLGRAIAQNRAVYNYMYKKATASWNM